MTPELKKQYPLFPELSEQGGIEAQNLIDKFKKQLIEASKDIVDNIAGELYCDVLPYVESDAWTNFRNDMLSGFRNYDNRKIQNEFDFKEIRQEIYKEFREDIIKDLDQDNLKEIEQLKEQIKWLQDLRC
jgi:hypothetical protein